MTAARAVAGKSLKIADSESSLLLQVLNRAHPSKSDYWDGNWLATTIEVASGAFKGRYSATLRADEFDTFKSELESLVQNERDNAHFEAMEEWLQIIAAREQGAVVLRCHCKSRSGAEGGLAFTVRLSSDDVARLLAQMVDLLAAFPVVGDPDVG